MSERIWISWTRQRRNKGVASGIGAPLYEISYEKYKCFRYVLSIFNTVWVLVKERPKICCAMVPSIFCATLLVLLKGFFRYKLIIDLHTLNIYYLLGEGKKRMIYDRLLKYCLDEADLIVVTNGYYAREIGQPFPKMFSLPDRIPEDFGKDRVKENSWNGNRVLCICSYDPDEPYEELFTVATNMSDIDFFFSGNFHIVEKSGKKLPAQSHIHFTGFLAADKYEELLCRANVILVATKLEGCLCCGAYEALAVGKPLVLSSTQALREYFGEGPIYTGESPKDIEKAIRQALLNQEEITNLVQKRAQELKEDWELKIGSLNALLRKMVC
jgi:glycosyltransferase involved in cell wall biosynthesis